MASASSGKGSRGNLAIVAGAVGALVLLVLGYVIFEATREKPAQAPEPAAEVAAPQETPAVEQPAEAVADTTEEAQAAAPVEEEAVAPAAPSFDVVRVDAEGNAVVAGHAAPGVMVEVLIDGAPVAQATADAAGNFVAIFTIATSDAPRVMTLSAGEGLVSAQSVIVAPAPVAVAEAEAPAAEGEAATGEMAAAAPAGETEVPAATAETAETVEAAQPPAGEEMAQAEGVEAVDTTADTQTPEAPADQPGAAPTLMLADASGITVIQEGSSGPEAMQNVTIDAISYDSEGTVEVSGRGQGASSVQVYLDNAPVVSADIANDGNWRTPLPEIATGVYTLRVDEIGEDGAVTSRIETPFKREEPGALAAAADQAGVQPGEQNGVQFITVQPGNTLWAIARGAYGRGMLYVVVYDANREKIRDPNLIYPGQVFALPSQ